MIAGPSPTMLDVSLEGLLPTLRVTRNDAMIDPHAKLLAYEPVTLAVSPKKKLVVVVRPESPKHRMVLALSPIQHPLEDRGSFRGTTIYL